MKTWTLVWLTAGFLWTTAARADLIEYTLPGSDFVIYLQGKATANPGGTMSFRHAKFGNLYFGIRDIQVHKVPTLGQQFQKRMLQATNKKDADGVFEAGVWALKHGQLDEYYEAVAKALELDPKHAESKRIQALRAQMEKPLPSSEREEKELREFVPRKQMKIATSAHFILLYDTPDKSEGGRKPRHTERLELLEKVYTSFLLTFFSKGVNLEVPSERLKVVLFHNHSDYREFSVRLSAELVSASGFYLPETNISFFFDHGTDEQFKKLQKATSDLQKETQQLIKDKVGGVKDIVRFANTLKLIVQISQESHDVEVVSHEATHQLAANTGLFPRQVRVPSWVHEGLAAYFESPNDGAWSGIGAVNKRRLQYYRALEEDREHSNINFIVGDQIFDYAGSIGATLHGYGQAWALTHFLIERHFDKFIAYYKQLGEMPPDMRLSPELLTAAFNQSFGADYVNLDAEWRAYMSSLKTDIELILDE